VILCVITVTFFYVVYGDDAPTTTETTFTDSRDKKVYKKVTIGNQMWMAENLNYAATGSKCYGEGGKVYENNKYTTLSSKKVQENCAKYGRLYNWATAQKACPVGWHLPSAGEYVGLVQYTGKGPNLEWNAIKLRSAEGWNESCGGIDSYGFSALPGGFGGVDGTFGGVGSYGSWWSYTEIDVEKAYSLNLCYEYYGSAENLESYKTGRYSVRCVNDNAVAVVRPPFTDSRDNKVYKVVAVGSQVWMAENLNYAAEKSKCYNNSEDSCAKYGRLYDYPTAMAGGWVQWKDDIIRGACPTGWHLPNDADWNKLVNYVGGSSKAGTKLKSSTGWDGTDSTPVGTDDYGFSALPGGIGSNDSNYADAGVGEIGAWWSTSGNQYNGGYGKNANIWVMGNTGERVASKKDDISGMNSIRCVQN
jgi:uncharacterized protein (TIGR02145 family)